MLSNLARQSELLCSLTKRYVSNSLYLTELLYAARASNSLYLTELLCSLTKRYVSNSLITMSYYAT